MPVTTCGVIIDPQGQSLAVTITPSAPVYTDAAGTAAAAFPATITSRTTWYMAEAKTYTISAKLHGAEIANKTGGTLSVSLNQGEFLSIAPTVDEPTEPAWAVANSAGDVAEPLLSRLWLGQGLFEVSSGSPTRAAVGPANNKWIAWTFDTVGPEVVGAQCFVPTHWNTYNAVAYWTVESGTGVNTVDWQFSHGQLANDDILTVTIETIVTDIAPTAATGSRLKTTTIGAAIAVDPTKIQTVKVSRIGASDTFNADADLFGLLLVKAS